MELDYVKLKPLKPALSGYIREAQALLKKSTVPDEKTVHDVRVLMKKARALLKLAGPQLDSDSFIRDISALKEVGRIMCSWRETSVQEKTLREFRKKFPDIFSQLQECSVMKLLPEKSETVAQPSSEMGEALEVIRTLLNKTEYRIRFQSMNAFDPQLLIRELENTYTRVSDVYMLSRNNPKPAVVHNLRKKTKDFLYQLSLFRPLNPRIIKIVEKNLDLMAKNLGKYNDITQIMKALDYKYSKGSNPPALDELVIKFREAQDKYLSKVWPISYRIFCPGQKLLNVIGFKLLII